jgi:hypothetical protein
MTDVRISAWEWLGNNTQKIGFLCFEYGNLQMH